MATSGRTKKNVVGDHRRNFREDGGSGPPLFWSVRTDPHFISTPSQKFCLVPLTLQTKVTPLGDNTEAPKAPRLRRGVGYYRGVHNRTWWESPVSPVIRALTGTATATKRFDARLVNRPFYFLTFEHSGA